MGTFTRKRRHLHRSGYTLIEVAIATVIVGLSVASLMLLVTTCTMNEAVAMRTSTALSYATNIGEMCEGLTRAQLLSMNGVSYSPAVDAQARAITEGVGWTQVVSTGYVSPNNVAGASVVGPTNLIRVNITVKQNQKEQIKLVRLFAFTEG